MGNRNNNNKEQYKKSGAVYSKTASGNYIGSTIINAWNKSKSRGLIKATVFVYEGTHEYTAPKTGNTFQTMMCKVFWMNSGVERLFPVSMNIKTKVVGIPDLGMCISPEGSGTTSGGKKVKGYFGTFNK